MDAPVLPVLMIVSVSDKPSPLKVIHPRTDRLGTQLDVNDAVITSNSESNDAQPGV